VSVRDEGAGRGNPTPNPGQGLGLRIMETMADTRLTELPGGGFEVALRFPCPQRTRYIGGEAADEAYASTPRRATASVQRFETGSRSQDPHQAELPVSSCGAPTGLDSGDPRCLR
jgi:hypothetical protein